MNKKTLLLLATAGLLGTPALFAQVNWVKIADFEDLPTTSTEDDLMAAGWIFHDYDFALYASCTDGTTDCTGVREIVSAPYEGGRGNALSIRGSDPNEIDPANAVSGSAFPLPVSIDVGEVATVYLRVAVEGRAISHHFGLMADDGSTNDLVNDPARLGYGDLAVTSQNYYGGSDHLRVYVNGAWNDATFDVSQTFDTETWYEIWWQVHNEPSSAGGGYFDVFIRGGVFEQITHLDNPYDEEFTDFPFRNKPDAPLTHFLVLMNPGWPSAGPLNRDAAFYDDLYIAPGVLVTESLDTTPPPPLSLWADVEAVGGVWKGTGLGYLYDAEFPWIYLGTEGWFYVDGGSSLTSIYLYDYTGSGWIWASNDLGGWHYDFNPGEWHKW